MVDYTIIQPGLMSFGNFKIHYNNEGSCKQTLNEIFDENEYYFESDKPNPFILDGGANIGISILYFKSLYPDAKIICFEPDPNAYQCLIKNIETNKLKDVSPVNAALSNSTEGCKFYGEVMGDTPDSRGNSILSSWGMQRKTSSVVAVKTMVLSTYLIDDVDFLKLDIEGAELIVFEGIASKLKNIKEMVIETHETATAKNADRIIDLLDNNQFVTSIQKREIMEYLPLETHEWASKAQPSLCIIKAKQL